MALGSHRRFRRRRQPNALQAGIAAVLMLAVLWYFTEVLRWFR